MFSRCICLFLFLMMHISCAQAAFPPHVPPTDFLNDHMDMYDAYHGPDDYRIKKALSGPAKKMSLKEAVLLSLRLNPNVQSGELQRVLDKFNVAVAFNQFEFQYAINGTATSTQSVSNGPPLATSRNITTQPNITKLSMYGTQYSLSMNNPVSYSSSAPHYFYAPTLSLDVVHPLFRNAGQAVTQANLNLALISDEVAKLNFKDSVMNQITQVVRDYYAVVGAENALIVDQAALKAAKETVEQNKVRIKIGFMAPAENVQAQAAVASQELQVASDLNAIQQARLTLLRDIGLPTSTNIVVDKTISTPKANWPKGNDASKLLFGNNISWLSAIFSIKSSKINLLLAEDQQRWVVNLTGNITQGGGDGAGSNGGLGSLFNGLNKSRTLGLAVTVPIDDMSIQQTLVAAKVSYTQLKLSVKQLKLTLQAQLLGAMENLSILFEQIKLAKNSVELANQSYLDAYKKATFGQASMFEVTTLQTNLINAQIQQISTEISFLTSLADYQLLLGITLDVWNIRLRY